jgi:hypothetical protein
MPLKKGSSKKTIKTNFEEFGKGKTFARTKAKFGAKKANKQRVAVVLSTARKTAKKKTAKRK